MPTHALARPMDIKQNTLAAIGNTPLVRLNRASKLTGCEIMGKAEFMNPGQSVKDRAALFIIKDAVERGTLRGPAAPLSKVLLAILASVSLRAVGNALGFKCVIVIPETQSEEKKDVLRLLGAELDRGSRRRVQGPEQLREALRPARRAIGQKQRCWSHLGQSVRQRSEPSRAHRNDWSGDLAADRGQGGRLHVRRRNRRHAGRRGNCPEGPQSG